MFQKNEKGFSFTLSPRPRNPSCGPFHFFCFGPTGAPPFPPRRPVRPASWPKTAQRPSPPCLAAKRAPPVGTVFLSGPSRTPARIRPRSPRARRRVPLGPARQGPRSALIKGTLDPLEILNPKPQPPLSQKPSPRRRHC